jgi:predicted kinase
MPGRAPTWLRAFSRPSRWSPLITISTLWSTSICPTAPGFAVRSPAFSQLTRRRDRRRLNGSPGKAEKLFALARTYCEPRVELGPVVAVGGLIGAGKSTLARSLGRSLSIPVIDSDRTRKALASVPATRQASAEAYTGAFTRQTYDELFRRADAVLGSGRGVILDATFRDRDLRLRARELAIRHGRPFRFVEAVCDAATLRARLRARAAAGVSVSDATEELLERFRREFEPVTELATVEHVPVRTTLPMSTQVQAVWSTLADNRRSADATKENVT